VELGYARVSTAKQDLERQIEALAEAGVARKRIYVDRSPAQRSTGRGCGRCSISRATGM
jgi:DNA invertase Pin-like site-specific DNA recombinase